MTKHNQQHQNNYNHYCYYSSLSLVKQITTILLLFTSITLLYYSGNVTACSRMMCAPIVSKCQLLDACKCETRLNYTCFKTCSQCLGDLYTDCCSCVDVCPKDEETNNATEAHVVFFSSANEDLFDLFVSEEDQNQRWHVHHQNITHPNSTVPLDCTMAFLASCVDLARCESSCLSMGANGFRWFHIGCCECFGKYCTNFGIDQVRCRNCPTDNLLKETTSDYTTQRETINDTSQNETINQRI